MILDNFFLIIDFDGINLGIKSDWAKTYLEFENAEEAEQIGTHWSLWIMGLIK